MHCNSPSPSPLPLPASPGTDIGLGLGVDDVDDDDVHNGDHEHTTTTTAAAAAASSSSAASSARPHSPSPPHPTPSDHHPTSQYLPGRDGPLRQSFFRRLDYARIRGNVTTAATGSGDPPPCCEDICTPLLAVRINVTPLPSLLLHFHFLW